jgi:hypothetical protein
MKILKHKHIVWMILLYLPFMAFTGNDDKPELRQKETAAFARMLEKLPDGGATGEQVAWNLNYYLGTILRNCDNGSDDWMLPTEHILNMLADKMATGPDGYKGFIGPYIYNEKEHWCDVHVGDAILVEHLLHFAMIVNQNPALKEKYGNSAQRFCDIARRDLIEKWEKRGTFVIDGPFAGYREWNMFCKPDSMNVWYREDHARGQDVLFPCLPFNKAMDMAYCMLQLHSLTGEASYKEKAEKIFNRVKAGMNPFQNGYTWNYWEPVHPEDINIHSTRNERILSHWVGTHPYRNYQEGEVKKIVFAYNMGITFTDADIQRLIHTNLNFMWNGDLTNPEWENSNSKLPGYKKAPPSEAYPTTAGIYWEALSQFDTTILYLSTAGRKPSPANRASLVFVRKYAPGAIVEEPVWMKGIGESAGQMEAIVIPSVVPSGENTVILSKSDAEMSPVEIWVRPMKGGTESLVITQKMGNGIQLFHVWDGKINGIRTPGEYVMIWRYRSGERAYPVTLK